jgi:hypothetical protein
MVRRRRPPSKDWKPSLRRHAAGIASADPSSLRTISFKPLSGWVTLRHARRRLVTIGVPSNPTAAWIASGNPAFPWDEGPGHFNSRPRGGPRPASTHRTWALGIRDHPTVPRSRPRRIISMSGPGFDCAQEPGRSNPSHPRLVAICCLCSQ